MKKSTGAELVSYCTLTVVTRILCSLKKKIEKNKIFGYHLSVHIKNMFKQESSVKTPKSMLNDLPVGLPFAYPEHAHDIIACPRNSTTFV